MKLLHLAFITLLSTAFLPITAYAQENTKISNANIEKRGLKATDLPRWKVVAPNIYAYEGLHNSGGMSTVNLIVVTTDGVVLTDGQGNPDQGQKLAESIKKLTPLPVKYLIVGSEHGDHMGGNGAIKAAWPDMVVISTPASQKALAKNPAPPTETVADKRALKLGGTDIELLNLGRAHTGGDLAVYLPQHKILFMSEIYIRGLFPTMRSAYPSEWVETIKKAQAMNATLYIPGHGWVDDAMAMKAGLEEFRRNLELVIAEGKRLHAAKIPCVVQDAGGVPSCEAMKQANWGATADLYLRDAQAPFAIAKVYQEIEGKLP